jgi:hypothetical protein
MVGFVLLTFGVEGNLFEVVGSFFSSGYYFLLAEKGFPGSPSQILPKNVILLNKGGPISQSRSK